MQFSTILVASLAAVVSAAPALPTLENRATRAGSCNVSGLAPPAAPTALPSPPAGSTLMMVAIGKGTQNYTCADSNPTTVPTQVGALATLYNASCLAAASQGGLNMATEWADKIPAQYMTNLPAVGQHYFVDSTTPTFNIDNVGVTECKKNGSSTAPANSNNDVPWLFLQTQAAGTTSKVMAAYRVETQGGSAPANCGGVTPGSLTVPYTAQYWFYSS